MRLAGGGAQWDQLGPVGVGTVRRRQHKRQVLRRLLLLLRRRRLVGFCLLLSLLLQRAAHWLVPQAASRRHDEAAEKGAAADRSAAARRARVAQCGALTSRRGSGTSELAGRGAASSVVVARSRVQSQHGPDVDSARSTLLRQSEHPHRGRLAHYEHRAWRRGTEQPQTGWSVVAPICPAASIAHRTILRARGREGARRCVSGKVMNREREARAHASGTRSRHAAGRLVGRAPSWCEETQAPRAEMRRRMGGTRAGRRRHARVRTHTHTHTYGAHLNFQTCVTTMRDARRTAKPRRRQRR